MIVDPVSVEPKLQTYIKAAKKQQRYVNTFTPVYCSDTIYSYYDDEYVGLNTSCYSTFDPRTDPLYAKDLTREELDALTNQKYFSEEELKYYFDLLVSRYCLPDKEYDIEESESEEDIDEAIDELKREINELKEMQQI